MKTLALFAALFSALALGSLAAESTAPTGKGSLHHVVAFKFKESAGPDQVRKVEEAFRGLKRKISQIRKFEWGTNVSPERHDKGFTHGFILTFESEKDRDDYLVHPEHKKFGELVGPVLADVFVIDFWARE